MLSLSQKYECRLYHRQALELPEKVGEIPLFSLHRIKSISSKGIKPLTNDVISTFMKILISKNIKYKKEIKRDWNCVTANHVVEAVSSFENELKIGIRTLIPKKKVELTQVDKETIKELVARKNVIIKILKEWFNENYDSLLYDTSKNIPWAIIQDLRARLNIWVFKNTNSFGDEINDVIFSVAKKSGIETENISAEDAWKKMGGKLFTE